MGMLDRRLEVLIDVDRLKRLEREGVGVGLVGGCTAESPDWFSYRRDGVTGRHGGAVVLRGAP